MGVLIIECASGLCWFELKDRSDPDGSRWALIYGRTDIVTLSSTLYTAVNLSLEDIHSLELIVLQLILHKAESIPL